MMHGSQPQGRWYGSRGVHGPAGRIGSTPAPRSQRPAAAPLVGYPLSAAEAVPVESVGEEYAWLRAHLAPGWHRETQSLVGMGDATYDVLRVRHADGSERDYWFDVTPVMGSMGVTTRTSPSGAISFNFNDGKLTVEGAGEGATCSNRRPCALPSSDSACDLMNGDLNAIPRVLFHCAGRSLLIGFGIFVAGERDWRRVLRGGVGAAVVIECFALIWAGLHRDPKNA